MNKFDENYIDDVQTKLPKGFQIITEGLLNNEDFIWFGAGGVWLRVKEHFPNASGVDVGVFAKVARKVQ